MNLSITLKMGLLTMLCSCIGVLSVSFFALRDAGKLLQQQSIGNISNDLLRESDLLEEKLRILRQDVLFLNKAPPVSGIIRASKTGGYDPDQNTTGRAWEQRLSDIFTNVLRQRGSYFQIRFIGVADNGKELVRVERKEGRISAKKKEALQRKGDRYYFREIIKLSPGEVYYSKIDLNVEGGEIEEPYRTTIRAGSPVYDEATGDVFGIVVINADFNKMAAGLLSPPNNTFYFLANNDGEYLIHPNRKKRYALMFDRTAKYTNDYPLTKENLEKLHRGGFEAIDLPEQSAGVVLRHSHFDPSSPDRFLAIGAVVDHSVIEATTMNLQHRLIAIAFFVALLLGAIVAFGVSVLTRPINKLKKAVDLISEGREDVEIPHLGNDEIGKFADSMRDMLKKKASSQKALKELAGSLEEQVKERTQKLRKSEQHIRTIVKTVGEGIVVVDSGSRILLVNEEISSIFGYSEDELLGKNIRVLMPEKYRADYEDGIRNYLGMGKVAAPGKRMELEGLRKNGTVFPIELRVEETAGDGEERLFTGSIRDITERKKGEEELKKVHADLIERNKRLERFHKITVDREMEMIKLKKEVNALLKEAGRAGKYEIRLGKI